LLSPFAVIGNRCGYSHRTFIPFYDVASLKYVKSRARFLIKVPFDDRSVAVMGRAPDAYF